jgi:hypothetical protein
MGLRLHCSSFFGPSKSDITMSAPLVEYTGNETQALDTASEFDIESDTAADIDESDSSEDGRSQHRVEYVLLGVYESFSRAKAESDTRSAFRYRYLTRYKTERLYARLYQCRSHRACPHRVKIVCVTTEGDSFKYYLYEGGLHTLDPINAPRRGIHRGLREEVDAMLRMGWGAKRLHTLLQLKYEDQPPMLAAMPTTRQLDNRKAYLVRNAPGGWDLRNYATFNAWASSRMCTTREQFFSVESADDPLMDKLIVLGTFISSTDDAGEPTSFGVIVSSRRVFMNVRTTVRDQGE